MKNIDVLCIGASSYDFVFKVGHHPEIDEKTTADSFVSCGGGPASNAALTVSKLGLTSAFCGYLGQDTFGRLHFDELNKADVNTDLTVWGEALTPVSTVWVKPGGQRSLVNYRPPDNILSPKDLDFSKINPKVILFDGHEPDVSEYLINESRFKDAVTILDAGSLNPGTSKLYNKVDYLVCSKKFAQEVTGESSSQESLIKLAEKNKNTIITLGSDGLLWKTEIGQGKVHAYEVTAVDTTGAGDVFHGAFAYCIVTEKNWDAALKFSSAAAAISCKKLGARTSIPYKNEVDSFLKGA